MPRTKNSRRSQRKSGAGYLSPAEFFNPLARQPSAGAGDLPITSEPVPGWVRPPMTATTMMSPNVAKTGGRRSRKNRQTRKNRMSGGFAPALMGGFVSNVTAAVVPLVLYGLYSTVASKSSSSSNSPKSKTKKAKSS